MRALQDADVGYMRTNTCRLQGFPFLFFFKVLRGMTDTHRDSGRPGLEDEDEFEDMLERKGHCADLGFALRTFNTQPYKGGLPCSTADLNKAVLESQYLRYVAKEIAVETGSSVEEVREEARGILEEMSQNLQLGFVRLMGYAMSKVFKRLFTGIHVNAGGLNTLQQAIQENPVILMPNHRSYMDFLAIPYIMFRYDIPVPVAAAGVNLAGMKMVGEILRRSGAFFIRRAIGAEKLYWAVLSEYVKTIVRKGFAPLEFYVEGLRSRTLKSQMPKLGMMHMVLEPYFKGEVFDVTLVPISISYDRVVEESLLAHELLGQPKPQESTTIMRASSVSIERFISILCFPPSFALSLQGLLKASKMLQENYGSMHVNFGRPVSVRQLCQGKINRCQYNLTPRDLPRKPSAEDRECVSWMAHRMVRLQEEGCVISPWSLMACLLLQTPTTVLSEEGLLWHQLTEKTLWLKKLALEFGARLNWPGHVPDSDVMSSTLAIRRSVVRREAGRVYLVQEEAPARRHPISPEERVVSTAAALLMLAAYKNQSVHIFVRPAMVAVALHVAKTAERDELFTSFRFLQDVFASEFIFTPGQSSQDFEEACCLLEKCGAVHISQEEVMSEAGAEVLSFLRALLQPFIQSYQVMFRYLCEAEDNVFSEKEFPPAVRSLATKLILSGELHTYDALSSDMQKNVLSSLQRLQAVTKLRSSEQNEYRVDKAAVRRIGDILSGKIPPQILQTAPDARL